VHKKPIKVNFLLSTSLCIGATKGLQTSAKVYKKVIVTGPFAFQMMASKIIA